MQLRDHALGELAHAAARADVRLAQEVFGARAVEARMHAGDEVERLADAQPPRQHGHVRDEAHIAHQLVALRARVPAEHLELALEGGQAEDGLERGRLAGAVGADEADDAARRHLKLTPSSARCAP